MTSHLAAFWYDYLTRRWARSADPGPWVAPLCPPASKIVMNTDIEDLEEAQLSASLSGPRLRDVS